PRVHDLREGLLVRDPLLDRQPAPFRLHAEEGVRDVLADAFAAHARNLVGAAVQPAREGVTRARDARRDADEAAPQRPRRHRKILRLPDDPPQARMRSVWLNAANGAPTLIVAIPWTLNRYEPARSGRRGT